MESSKLLGFFVILILGSIIYFFYTSQIEIQDCVNEDLDVSFVGRTQDFDDLKMLLGGSDWMCKEPLIMSRSEWLQLQNRMKRGQLQFKK